MPNYFYYRKFTLIELIRKEVDEKENTDYIGIDYDSDIEPIEQSDDEYQSDSEVEVRKPLTYDIDTMFDIIYKRDYRQWSLSTIHSKYKQVSSDPYGRVQLHR